MISFVFTMFVRAKASAQRIDDVFKTVNTIIRSHKPEKFISEDRNVEFINVTFSYSKSNEPALRDITFKCNKGETLGIIGSTGSGKTSLVNLIPRFYDVDSGIIKVNGTDIKEINIRELRERIAVVPQKTVLFTGTIMDNLKWGNENAGIEEIQNAAKAAQAHEFIVSFPDGYNTMLGQGGVNLSGGQKQRISNARALIKEPEILVLDDCTSAVDMATENEIKKSLKKFSENLICIVIAQRITSIMNCDNIIVLDNGKIAGQGSHRALMDKCDVYKDIFHSQLGKELE
jgi:ATP-binding cassette subfamily B protein